VSDPTKALRDAQTAIVLSEYGRVMQGVQAFEQTLAVLILTLEIRPGQTRTYDTPAAFQRHLRRLLKRYTHIFQRASASELRRELPDDFDEGLAADIERAVKWRDVLAHRFLLERVAPDGNGAEGMFRRGTLAKLGGLAKDYHTLNARLLAAQQASVSSRRKGDGPEWMRDLFAELARPVMYGEPMRPREDRPNN
jgi:hypothetical protein